MRLAKKNALLCGQSALGTIDKGYGISMISAVIPNATALPLMITFRA
jgi:hypothetical protein